MRYPIVIEPGDDQHAWGVVVPDLPGCFSAADSGIDEAIDNAKEAIAAWIEAVMDAGGDVPAPLPIETHRANPEFAGWVWAVAEVDPAVIDDRTERVNITLPRRVLNRLDTKARAAGQTRSGYIAKLALEARTT
ncbi:phage-like protein [Betaproteobacteria bacterium]|nr:phage-like protein [Betaproteobacteria bacterium]GHT94545.1 phage-like protein [Betaproteobacteria bacterium]GHU14072.1 phage-like protein [Betaproteobacteria bacterium]GHU17745.1 phage-like protein [Betaproteobacteria bacterium]